MEGCVVFSIVSVPAEIVRAGAEAFEKARQSVGFKLETVAYLMGEMSREQLSQELRGAGRLDANRLLMLTGSVDGRLFLDALLAEYAALNGTEQLDAVARGLSRLTAMFSTRMAKADVHTEPARLRA